MNSILISGVYCLNKFRIVKIISKLCTLKIRLDEQDLRVKFFKIPQIRLNFHGVP